MRITNNMLFGAAIRNINSNRERLLRTEETLITNKQINRPSDNPIGASRLMDLRGILSMYNQYQRNIEKADAFSKQTETALDNVKECLVRVQEIVMQQLNGVQGPEGWSAAAAELEQIFGEILRSANTKYENKYIFAGHQTLSAPFDQDGNYLGGSGDDIDVEISEGNFVTINLCGDEVFKGAEGGPDIFDLINSLKNAVEAGDTATLRSLLPTVDDAINFVVDKIAGVGAITNRLQMAEGNNTDLIAAITEMISNIEDTDVVKAATDYANQELVLRAVLETSSRLVQQSILDFLR